MNHPMSMFYMVKKRLNFGFNQFWLQPIVVEYNHGYNTAELNHILKLTRQNQDKLLEVWNGYFSK